jgi:SAM-dependent methyltransferase
VDQPWTPPDTDTTRPSAARIYDYLLGGTHNFAVDRAFARDAVAAIPDLAEQARANRAFLHRAVRYLLDAGVRQFLDLGSGIPTVGNVHEIAQSVAPESAVAYVDLDPIAVEHSRHILAGNPRVAVVRADLRRPGTVLADAGLRAVLDLEQPVAILAIAVLHAIGDDDEPAKIISRFRDALGPGSYLVIAHGVDTRPDYGKDLVDLSRRTTTPLTLRTRAQIEAMFDGFDLVEPGLVWAPQWHPEAPQDVPPRPELSGNLVGVGRRP